MVGSVILAFDEPYKKKGRHCVGRGHPQALKPKRSLSSTAWVEPLLAVLNPSSLGKPEISLLPGDLTRVSSGLPCVLQMLEPL